MQLIAGSQVLTGWRKAKAHGEGIKLDIIPYINLKSKIERILFLL